MTSLFKISILIKKILVPTDFSELGNIAYGVAKVLAKSTQAEITALSIVPGPSGAVYSTIGELTNDEGNDYSEWHNRLEKNKELLQKWMADKPEITESIAVIGNVEETVLYTSQSNDIDLIVMGTEGVFNNKVWSKMSHTEYVTNHSNIPVLSLKCNRDNIDLNELVLVSDFLDAKRINLSVIKDIQKAYKSKLKLLKILTPMESRAQKDIFKDMESFAHNNELSDYEFHTFNAETVESGIGKFAAEQDIDLISLGSHQGLGLSKLFRSSISDDVVNHLYHPVLTFPI